MGLSLVGADEEEGRREIGFLFVQGVRVEYLQGTREVRLCSVRSLVCWRDGV